MPRPLRLAAQGAGRRRRAQPALAAGRHRPRRGRPRRRPRSAGRRHPHRRHTGRRTGPFPREPVRHPHHDARVPVLAPDLERPRCPPLRRDRHRRRDPRPGGDQARRPPGALARATRGLAPIPPQRIGLSATQRPLDEVARFLGGAEDVGSRQSAVGSPQATVGIRRAELGQTTAARRPSVVRRPPRPEFSAHRTTDRPVTIVDAGAKKACAQRRGAGRGHGPAGESVDIARAGRCLRRALGARYGPRSIRGSWSSSGRTARRSCS